MLDLSVSPSLEMEFFVIEELDQGMFGEDDVNECDADKDDV